MVDGCIIKRDLTIISLPPTLSLLHHQFNGLSRENLRMASQLIKFIREKIFTLGDAEEIERERFPTFTTFNNSIFSAPSVFSIRV
jgi:hypothetical protein